MASLDAYIAQVNHFGNNLNKIVTTISKTREQDILNIIRRRLLERGQDANLSFIGPPPYAPSTIEDKKSKGQEWGHFTLFDTGSFHAGMFIKLVGGLMIVSSSDSKTNLLINTYGVAILGLTEPETKFVIQFFIDPRLQDIINNFPQTITI